MHSNLDPNLYNKQRAEALKVMSYTLMIPIALAGMDTVSKCAYFLGVLGLSNILDKDATIYASTLLGFGYYMILDSFVSISTKERPFHLTMSLLEKIVGKKGPTRSRLIGLEKESKK